MYSFHRSLLLTLTLITSSLSLLPIPSTNGCQRITENDTSVCSATTGEVFYNQSLDLTICHHCLCPIKIDREPILLLLLTTKKLIKAERIIMDKKIWDRELALEKTFYDHYLRAPRAPMDTFFEIAASSRQELIEDFNKDLSDLISTTNSKLLSYKCFNLQNEVDNCNELIASINRKLLEKIEFSNQIIFNKIYGRRTTNVLDRESETLQPQTKKSRGINKKS